MKKLLLLSSFIGFIVIIYSCQKRQAVTSSESNVETKPVIKQDAAIATDTAKSSGQTVVSGSSNQSTGSKKDSVHSSGKPTAITHPSPEQEKLDSIKKAKLKDQK